MLVWLKSNAFTFILPPIAGTYYAPAEVLGMQRRNAKFLPSRRLWSVGDTALPDVQITTQLTGLLLWWRYLRHERTLQNTLQGKQEGVSLKQRKGLPQGHTAPHGPGAVEPNFHTHFTDPQLSLEGHRPASHPKSLAWKLVYWFCGKLVVTSGISFTSKPLE